MLKRKEKRNGGGDVRDGHPRRNAGRGKTIMSEKSMKKVIKITSNGRYPMYVHAAYDRSGNVIRYFLLNYLHGVAPIDPEDVRDVIKIAKAEALNRGFDDVHASTIDYKPKSRSNKTVKEPEGFC